MMKLKWIGSLLILAGIVGCKTPDRPNLVEYVNPNIGTVHSRWFFYTPAAEPFGLAKLGASTNGTYGNNQGWEAVGYEDGHTSIDGFPCLHEFQIGGISLMPVTGEVKTNPGKLEEPDKGFRSRFDKKDETARPGYYSVLLKDYQVKAELTATARVGFQRYTFPESENAHILFNIGNRQGESGAVRDAYIKQIDENTIEGYVITEPEYVKKYQAGASVAMYFYAKLDRAPESVEVFYQDSALTARNEIKGPGAIMCLNYKTKKDGLSPYMQLTDKRVYPDVEGRFEDPVVWRDELQYHLIVNDWLGRIAFYQRSKDGVHWVTEQGEAYVPGVSFHKDGAVEHWFKYERPKVFQDEKGRAVQMNFAVIDTIKWNDLPNDKHSSKNISIPLNKGMLLSVLNEEEITPSTRTIEVKIAAESGFNPQTDVDVKSLRFGSFTEVNFGRGCKPVKTKVSGKDLIVVFKAKGSGITSDEFAPKMIGKDKKGNMLYGYARLPYVNYRPALLSARRPLFDKEKGGLKVEIQNFGLSASEPTEVEVICNGSSQRRIALKTLQPYEIECLMFDSDMLLSDDNASYEVVFFQEGKEVERNKF